MGPPTKTPKTVVSVDQILAMEKGQMMNLVKMSYGCATMEELLNLVSSFLSELKPPDKGTNEQTNNDKKDKVNEKRRIKERLMFFHSIYKEISKPQDNDKIPTLLSQLRNPERQSLLTNPQAMRAVQQIQQGLDHLYSVAPSVASQMGLGGAPTVLAANKESSGNTTTAQPNLYLPPKADAPKNNVDYLSSMSDLLALYIDLEVVTCLESLEPEKKKKSERKEKEEKERRKKELMSRIVSSLYTMLDQSEDHILDTVLKLRPPFNEDPNKEIFHSIYASIYRCVAKRAAKRQVKDLTYVRYVLVYKLWDNIAKDDEREDVIKQAATHLLPPPGFLKRRRTLPRILPKPTNETKNLTEFYLRERYSVWKRAKKLLEATSQAAHQSTMFPNFSCKPRLLNPKIQETSTEPSPSPNGPVEEITTPQSIADDLWTRLRCEEPLSETSLTDQVTFFKKPRKLTVNKMYKSLNRHYLRDKAKVTKKSTKKARPTGPGRGDYVKGMKSSKAKGGDLQETPSIKSKKLAKNSIKSNKNKNKALELPEPPVLKKVKTELWEPLENHVSVHSSYDTYKKEPPVISAAVSPFIANITKPTCSSMPPPAAPPAAGEKKPHMVDASVSSVEDLDWTFLKPSLDLKQDQSLHQSCSSPPEKPVISSSEAIAQSIFEKPANYQESLMEDLLKGPLPGICGQDQKKDQVKISVDGSIGMMVDSQFPTDLNGFDLDDPMWSEPVDPITDPILHKWFSDCPPDDLSTPVPRSSAESQDWSHHFSSS